MRLAISNIAWNVPEDEDVAKILNKYSIDAIDIAPGKYFSDFANTTSHKIDEVKSWWSDRGVEITGMQSLLFGTEGLNVFGPPEIQHRLLKHLEAVCRIASRLGSTRLVFGSPKNRNREGLTDKQAIRIATIFFRQLGDIAMDNGVIVCLEPNPTCYGANFMTSSPETAQVVNSVSHPAIRMQFDTGALSINQESAEMVLAEYSKLIGHIHASEPDLVPLGDSEIDHSEISAAIQKHIPNHPVTLEMVTTKNEPHLVSIERALKHAIRSYRTTTSP